MYRSIPTDKVLVLGDGLLGSEIVNQTGWDCASRKLTGLDITKYFDLERLILKYDTVVNCIANTNSYSYDKKAHFEVNYNFIEAICSITFSERIKLVHISTEFVYANNKITPTEEDVPQHDATWYAYTKLLADEYIQQNHNNYLICRELHKPNPFPYDKVWKVQTSGDTVDKIAELIIKLINTDAQGVFNVGTGDKWLRELAPNAEEIEAPPHVPKDTRMNLDKLNKWLSEN
jgi:nucleoside-diphosphate-sugar epimerase